MAAQLPVWGHHPDASRSDQPMMTPQTKWEKIYWLIRTPELRCLRRGFSGETRGLLLPLATAEVQGLPMPQAKP